MDALNTVLQGPLPWLVLTLGAFALADRLSVAAGRHPLANPVLIAVIVVATVLLLGATPYATYMKGAQYITLLLGPATVALALPLRDNLPLIRQAALPIIAALVAGSFTAAITAIGLGTWMGLDFTTIASLAPKSATSPVAIGIAERIGGLPTLAAVLAISTGMIGAITVTPLMSGLRIRDRRARGFAAGVAAHGIGTARAFQVNPTSGAFAALGMGLNALLTPLVAAWILGWLPW